MFIGHESHAHRSVLKPLTDQRRPKDFITKGKAEEAPTLALKSEKGAALRRVTRKNLKQNAGLMLQHLYRNAQIMKPDCLPFA